MRTIIDVKVVLQTFVKNEYRLIGLGVNFLTIFGKRFIMLDSYLLLLNYKAEHEIFVR